LNSEIGGNVIGQKEVVPVTGNVQVVCRFRPLNEREQNKAGDNLCVKFLDDKTCTVNHTDAETGKEGAVKYSYDKTFDPSATQ